MDYINKAVEEDVLNIATTNYQAKMTDYFS